LIFVGHGRKLPGQTRTIAVQNRRRWAVRCLFAFLAASFAGAVTCVAITAQAPSVPQEDCVTYTPDQMRIVDKDARGWLLERHDGAIFAQLDNRTDAEASLAVARRHSAICYIGRDNKRPNHDDYVMVYWK
jgi:hypothetical protein